ncbi:tape-measure protein [Streptomyces sp. MBT65]|uniref:tape-measure protein n=1 Tax=Streptomyces sp. MBT65 TaxID=1488395 RepID=UPI00190DA6C2|nr:tape-measure protein [Streptomyces sp. MBT65]MBK3576822.1 tape-measure protein [Streptomyces sp. MBT65]
MSGAVTALCNPLAGAAPALRSFRSRVQQTQTGVRSLTERVTGTAADLDRVATPATQTATAVQQIKTNADTAARSVTRTAQTATTAASGIKSTGTKSRSTGKSLGKLTTNLGGVFAIVGTLIAASGVLGGLLDTFGTAMTIGSGVMIIINALTRANPIGFVAGLLLPLAGWLLDIALNSETGQRLMDQLATLILKYVQSYLTILTPILKLIASAVNTYVTGYLTLITTTLSVLGTVIGTGFAALKALTTGDTRALSGKVSTIWTGFKNAVRPALNWITKEIPAGFTRIRTATANTLRAMGQFVTTGAQTVAGVVKGPIEGLVAFANWVIDGLNKISFSVLGKKFGVHLSKIPMLAEGGIAIPGAHTGRVLSLTTLDRRRTRPATRGAQHTHRIQEFHERNGTGSQGTAADLLFLAAAHARA